MVNTQVLHTAAKLWREIDEKAYWKSNKEKDFEKHITAVLNSAGMVVIKLPDESQEYVFPDLLVHCRLASGDKYTFYIECKAAARRYRRSQKLSFELLEPYVDIFPATKGSDWIELLEALIDKTS